MPMLPDKLAALVDWIESVPDRADRIQLLVDVASRFERVPEHIASRPYPRSHRTPACESEVYVFAEPQGDGTLKFHFAVENPQGVSAKATAVLLDEGLSGASLAEVVAVPPDFVQRVFGNELSMGKSMGLMGMVSMCQHLAERAGRGEPLTPAATAEGEAAPARANAPRGCPG
jgi:cysteine desulfuration protein SufE